MKRFSYLMIGICLVVTLISGFIQTGNAAEAAGGLLTVPGVGSMVLPDWLEAKAAKPMDGQQNAGLQFDMTGLSKDTWHYARLVSYRSEQNLGPAALLFGAVESNPQLLVSLIQPMLARSMEENGGKVLEWFPAKKASLGGRSVPVLTARLIMTDKVPMPMFATVYVFMHQDKVSAMGMFCPDSDRLFWSPLFGQMAGQLKWE